MWILYHFHCSSLIRIVSLSPFNCLLRIYLNYTFVNSFWLFFSPFSLYVCVFPTVICLFFTHCPGRFDLCENTVWKQSFGFLCACVACSACFNVGWLKNWANIFRTHRSYSNKWNMCDDFHSQWIVCREMRFHFKVVFFFAAKKT